MQRTSHVVVPAGDMFGAALAWPSQEIQASTDKRRSSAKRKLSQLQQEAGQWVVEAERKIARVRSEAGKLPGLANMMRSFMA